MPDDQLQRALDTRAIELASGASAVTNQHLIECRDRYLAMERSLDRLSALMWKIAASTIFLLILMLGYFLVKFGLPGAHS